MKFNFKIQQYQTDAVDAVVKVFNGQGYHDKISYIRDKGKLKGQQTQLTLAFEDEFGENLDILDDTGYKNEVVELSDEQLLKNIHDLQSQNNIKLSSSLIKDLGRCSLDIEMETGTGKTYVYIKTMFELNKRYGWSKFIIVVPSIAIREGVKKSFEITAEHFMEHYGKKARFFVYNSSNLNALDNFSQSSGINVMIINTQAFASSLKEDGKSKEARIIYSKRDEFASRRPIDVIKANRPIIILDEPQKMGGEVTQKALKNFNPLFSINYSATHAKQHNLVYVLDALDAFNKRLVKKIEVKGFEVKNFRGTDKYMFLEQIVLSSKKPPMAKIEIEISYNKSINRETRIFGVGDDLYYISQEMEQYKGFTISEIDPFRGAVTFTNGEVIYTGDVVGDVSEKDMRRIQIRETILSHFEKEEKLFNMGIKTLSLFFIDEVAKYRQYDENGDEVLGEYGKMFEEEYISVLNQFTSIIDSPYQKYLKEQCSDVSAVDDLFRQIHKKCKKQLFPIWKWLIENFVPYMDYSSDNGYSLSTGVIANGSYIDDKFISELANYIAENNFFGKVIMELSPSLDNEYGTLFAHLLKNKHFDLVKEMFKICANKDIDSAHICGVIYGFMEACSNYNELETMELFEQHIFPLIKAIDKPDIQDNISAWEDEIKEYYNYCEDNCEQYQFTRKNAWRKQHKKEAEKLGLNVLYYDSEEEYLQDYNTEKYSWRDSYSTDDTYGLNPSDFETEDALNKAISKKIEQEEKQTAKEYKLAEETTSTLKTQAQSRQNSSYSEDMKRFEDDTIYTFIGVLFPYTSHHYHYLTDDDSITIGDYVVVPVGVDNKESVAKVVSVEKHLRISAPFPVEKTKKIIGKYVKDDTPLKKLRLISNNICYGPCPDADEEVEQHLTIISDGRVWFSRYNYGLGDGKYELAEKKQLNIGKDIAVDILAFTKKYFDEKGIVMKCTDIGIWELFLTDENDAKYTIDGSVVPDDYTSEISNYIRERLPLENLFLFDGNI